MPSPSSNGERQSKGILNREPYKGATYLFAPTADKADFDRIEICPAVWRILCLPVVKGIPSDTTNLDAFIVYKGKPFCGIRPR